MSSREKQDLDLSELRSYIESHHSIIYIKTNDSFYAKKLIELVRNKYFKSSINDSDSIIDPLDFDPNDDFSEIGTNFSELLMFNLSQYLKNNKNLEDRKVKFIVTYNFKNELEDKKVISILNSIIEKSMLEENLFFYVFIISNEVKLPEELKQYVTIFEPNNLSDKDLESILNEYKNIDLLEQNKKHLLSYLKGLSEIEVYRILNFCFQKQGYIDKESLNLIAKQKKQIIKKSNLLELVEVEESINLDYVGGLKNLKDWLVKKQKILSDSNLANNYGVKIPKGIMLVGIPGCGKSLVSKVTSNYFGYPLLKLDIGKILGKYVGESEQNFEKALKLAESVSPCILWIDEIEKAISSSNTDSNGVSTRIFGHFLTWMQEKKSNVFIIATANDISKFPPEFLRKGRFDKVFYVDFPKKDEISDIFEIHLKGKINFLNTKSKNKLFEKSLFNEIKGISYKSNLSGADIEFIINDVLEEFFLKRDTLKNENEQITFITTTLQENINNYKTIDIKSDTFKKFEEQKNKLKEIYGDIEA